MEKMDLSTWRKVSRSEAERFCRSTTGTIPVIIVRPNGRLETGWVMALCDGMGDTMVATGLCKLRVGYYVEGGLHHFEEVNDDNVEIYINISEFFI